MENKIRYRLCLTVRVGKRLSTEETALSASLGGREVTIRSERPSQPLSEASWLLIACRGFETEDDARDFGETLRRAVHLAGLCTRVGIDADDRGEDDIRVLRDDGMTLCFSLGRADGEAQSNAGDFVQALEDAFPESDVSGGDAPSIRRAIGVLSLAEMNADPIAKVVLAISTVEGLATHPSWTDPQKALIESTAEWLQRMHGHGEETGQIVEAIRKIRNRSIRQRVRKMLASNDLPDLRQDWDDLYSKRSRLYHGQESADSDRRADHLTESELHALGQEAMKLCARIVLSMAIRQGIPVPQPS